MPPSSEYLLLDDHPARTTLYTPSEDMAKKKSKPMLRSAITKPGAKGITANERSAVATMIPGASTKTGLSAKGGIQPSFKKSFTESASGCKRPNGPTRLGP